MCVFSHFLPQVKKCPVRHAGQVGTFDTPLGYP